MLFWSDKEEPRLHWSTQLNNGSQLNKFFRGIEGAIIHIPGTIWKWLFSNRISLSSKL